MPAMPMSPRSPIRRRLLALAALSALPSGRASAAQPPAGSRSPLLASVYTGQVDPARCLVSEKYDGVRALWDGQAMRHRSGRELPAPADFLAALPPEPLDGELWLGRGSFETLSALVRTRLTASTDWRRVRYMVFEMPAAAGTFLERSVRLEELVRRTGVDRLVAAPQERVASPAELRQRLGVVIAAGGEGLMLHRADAAIAHGRSDVLMKLKPHLDAEATVVGHRPGEGKYRGQVGALAVEAADGRRFLVGSGLSDALRREPPAVGEVITYRYRDLTSRGLPRFATFLRRHEPD